MEIFQHVLQQNLQGIKGILNLAEDIFVFGKTRREHDLALKMNPQKCNFLISSIEFFRTDLFGRRNSPRSKT